AKHAELARDALDAVLRDQNAATTWKEVAFDLRVRVGMALFARGDGGGASDSFGQAAQTPGLSEDVRQSLTSLAEAANVGKPVLPTDVRGSDDAKTTKSDAASSKAVVALTLGVIQNVAGRYDRAQAYFDRVLNGDLRAKSGVQLAFASFGKATALQGQNKLTEAKETYLASLKTFRSGTWHDETLYRMASVIGWQAEGEAAPAPPADADPKPKRPITPDEEAAQLAAEKERRARLSQAKTEAGPYWEELVKSFPDSPRAELALYSAGVLLCQTGRPTDGAALLRRVIAQSPSSHYAGEGYVRLIDLALEQGFDLNAAEKLSAQGVQWAKQTTKVGDEGQSTEGARESQSPSSSPASIEPWRIASREPALPDVKRVAYEVYLRAGLTAYLGGTYELALQMFNAAGPQAPPDKFTDKADLALIGLHYLIKAAKEQKSVTEERALKDAAGNDRQRTAIQLADLYLEAIRPDKAEDVLLRLIEGDPIFGKTNPAVEGYAILQLAVALDRQSEKRPQALVWLRKLRDEKYAKTYWGPYGLFRLALFTFNQKQNPKLSMPLYREMFVKYPDHPMAELAHLYFFIEAVQLKEVALADEAGRAFQRKYPDSEFKAVVDEHLKQNEKNQQNSNAKGRKEER
ncbi:MAG: tetratricopeptide repeat protein, partial [Tepidisphaeraceae bacterium]